MIGDRIRELRNMRKFTQKDMAAIMGLSRGAINKYEMNERTPDIGILIKFAEYFGVSLDYLCGREPSAKEIAAYEIVGMFDNKGLAPTDVESNEFKMMIKVVNSVLDAYCSIKKK